MKAKSQFYKEYTQIWLPDPLRSPLTLKIFWYRRIWNATLGRLISAIAAKFKKDEEPEEVISLASQSEVEAPPKLEVVVNTDG